MTPNRDDRWQTVLDDLRASSAWVALVAAGGGSGAIGRCFERPGASRTFVEAVIAYSHGSMRDYLGEPPVAGSASAETARQLARRACGRARSLDPEIAAGRSVSGIALVAVLPSESVRSGSDRVHVALKDDDRLITWSVELPPDRFSRAAAETISDEMLRMALAGLTRAPDDRTFFEELGLEVRVDERRDR